MTARPQSEPQPKSRRALLAGALGGVGAWAASMVGRATPAVAGEGDPIRMGQWNYARGTHTQLQTNSSGSAFRVIQLSGSFALRGDAESGRGVMGVAGSQGTGVWGYSPDHRGVFGRSDKGVAVYAESSGGTGTYAFGRSRCSPMAATLASMRAGVICPRYLGTRCASRTALSSGQ